MPELSIIVPIYKAEQYLECCLESILKQKYQDYEVILVDDGSPDRCPRICDAYTEKSGKIRVIHQRNQGAVKARMTGLKEATGSYITFMDADDRIDADYYERMMRLAKDSGADITISGYREGTEERAEARENRISSGVYRGGKLAGIKNRCLFDGVYYQAGIVPALWNKVIRREALQSIRPVSENIRMGDDAAMTYPLLNAAACIAVDNDNKGYLYRTVEQSMSRKHDPAYFARAQELVGSLEEQLKDDDGMLRQLDYYVLFILELGMNQQIAAGGMKGLLKTCGLIRKTIRQFALADRIGRMDLSMMDSRARKRIRFLQADRPGQYLGTILADSIRRRMGKS